MPETENRERLISALLLLLFLIVAGATARFIYKQTRAGEAEEPLGLAQGAPAAAPEPSKPAAPATKPKPRPASLIPPRLLNLSELRENIRKFYPEAERAARKEGRVSLSLQIEADGSVSRADVKGTAGDDFDAAARKVALAMRFAPARKAGMAVAVTVDEGIDFVLDAR